MKPIEVKGVWLMRTGGENDPNAQVEVHVQTSDGWHHIITEHLGANFSHAVSSDGIREAPLSDFDEYRATCSRGGMIGKTLGIIP